MEAAQIVQLLISFWTGAVFGWLFREAVEAEEHHRTE